VDLADGYVRGFEWRDFGEILDFGFEIPFLQLRRRHLGVCLVECKMNPHTAIL
jgi:hypothetical protein